MRLVNNSARRGEEGTCFWNSRDAQECSTGEELLNQKALNSELLKDFVRLTWRRKEPKRAAFLSLLIFNPVLGKNNL